MNRQTAAKQKWRRQCWGETWKNFQFDGFLTGWEFFVGESLETNGWERVYRSTVLFICCEAERLMPSLKSVMKMFNRTSYGSQSVFKLRLIVCCVWYGHHLHINSAEFVNESTDITHSFDLAGYFFRFNSDSKFTEKSVLKWLIDRYRLLFGDKPLDGIEWPRADGSVNDSKLIVFERKFLYFEIA